MITTRIASLASICEVATCAEALAALGGAG